MVIRMEYTLLRRAAESAEGLILHDTAEIQAFQLLLNKGLVAGRHHTPEDRPAYAVIHCLTPDGRAMLSLTEYVARARLKASIQN